VIVSDPSRSNLFGRAYSKSFTRKIVLKAGIFLQAIDKANAAVGVWANPKWVLLPYKQQAARTKAKTKTKRQQATGNPLGTWATPKTDRIPSPFFVL
jgi:hypothetical protein